MQRADVNMPQRDHQFSTTFWIPGLLPVMDTGSYGCSPDYRVHVSGCGLGPHICLPRTGSTHYSTPILRHFVVKRVPA